MATRTKTPAAASEAAAPSTAKAKPTPRRRKSPAPAATEAVAAKKPTAAKKPAAAKKPSPVVQAVAPIDAPPAAVDVAAEAPAKAAKARRRHLRLLGQALFSDPALAAEIWAAPAWIEACDAWLQREHGVKLRRRQRRELAAVRDRACHFFGIAAR